MEYLTLEKVPLKKDSEIPIDSSYLIKLKYLNKKSGIHQVTEPDLKIEVKTFLYDIYIPGFHVFFFW